MEEKDKQNFVEHFGYDHPELGWTIKTEDPNEVFLFIDNLLTSQREEIVKELKEHDIFMDIDCGGFGKQTNKYSVLTNAKKEITTLLSQRIIKKN